MKCIKDQEKDPKSKPRWIMGPSINHLLYEGDQYPGNKQEKDFPPHPGLVDFCPSDDGTLFISLTTRKIDRDERADGSGRGYYYYTAIDSNSVYTAVYRIDLKKLSLTVEPYEEGSKDAWVKLPGGENAEQVQKLPIYCWLLMEGLKGACQPETWKT